MATKYRPRRFKVQKRVDLWARDSSDKPFLVGTLWRTLNEHDKQTVAETTLAKRVHDAPGREFRIAEEWPIGSNLRPILSVTAKTSRQSRRR